MHLTDSSHSPVVELKMEKVEEEEEGSECSISDDDNLMGFQGCAAAWWLGGAVIKFHVCVVTTSVSGHELLGHPSYT